jgi:hypothetical protein
MIGNISKSKAEKGEALTFDMLTDIEKESLKGETGAKGDKGDAGDTPSISVRYDETTGDLWVDTDGIMHPQDYIATHNLVPKGYVGKLSELKTIDKTSIVAAINELFELCAATRSYVTIRGGAKNWNAEAVKDSKGKVIGYRYGQKVEVENAIITNHSKVDLQVTSEQMVVFYEKDLAFMTENDGGVITVYCVGSIPENDYKIQAIVTEVV